MKREQSSEASIGSAHETKHAADESCQLELPLPVTSQSGGNGAISKWSAHFAYNLEDDLLAFVLYLTAFATGVLDATTYADFRTFASNQTGNTILMTLAILDTIPVAIGLTAASLGSYLVFSFVFGHLGHHFGDRTRGWLVFSCLLQLALLSVAIGLSYWLDIRYGPVDNRGWPVMCFLAASAGVQVAMARTVGIAEVPTAMLSSPFVDFFTDPHLFRSLRDRRAQPRNRRAIYIVSIISGSFVGAATHRYVGTAPAIYVALGVKAVVAVYVTFAKTPTRVCACFAKPCRE